jgi:peroxiredoxin
MRVVAGEPAKDFTAVALDGKEVSLAGLRGQPVWLAFFRFAACPFCNYRIHELLAQWPRRFAQHRFTMLGVFQSPADSVRSAVERQRPPFIPIPDPEMHLYALYGLETRLGGVLTLQVPRLMLAARAAGIPLSGRREGPVTRIPADFLIDAEGQVRVAYYGRNVADHVPFEDVERFLAGG